MFFWGRRPAKTWILSFSGLGKGMTQMGWPAKTGFLKNSGLENSGKEEGEPVKIEF